MKKTRGDFRSEHIHAYLAVLRSELTKSLDECEVLDVGCSTGYLTADLAPYVKNIKGIDIISSNIRRAQERAKQLGLKKIRFAVQSGFDLNDNKKYDIVILSDVLEHVKSPELLLKKCLDILKDDGIMYVNVPNKWFPMEPHKKLPFLSYFPPKMADKYSKLFRKGSYQGYHLLSYSEFVRLLDLFPIIYIFKPLTTRPLYKIGKKFIDISAIFWRFAPAFQVIIKKIKYDVEG